MLLRLFALTPLLVAACALADVPRAANPPGLIPNEPASPWRNVGFANWVNGHAGAMGVFIGVSVDPSDHARILTATQIGGLWLSEDAGKTWKNVDWDIEGMNSWRSIRFAFDRPAIVYAAGTHGLIKSEDGGRSWKKLTDPLVDRSAHYPAGGNTSHRITVDCSGDGRVVFFGTEDGLFRSDDAGATWSKLSAMPADTVRLHPKNPDILYATCSKYPNPWMGGDWSDFHRSEDGGKTWTKITENFPVEYAGRMGKFINILYLGVCQTKPDRVVVMGFGSNYHLRIDNNKSTRDKIAVDRLSDEEAKENTNPLRGVKGLWISEDAGKTFTDIWSDEHDVQVPTPERPNLVGGSTLDWFKCESSLHQGVWDMWFDTSDTNPDVMVAGAYAPWMTFDGGKTWQYYFTQQQKHLPGLLGKSETQAPGNTDEYTVHGDFQQAVVRGEKAWFGNDGQLLFSDDRMAHMRLVSRGITGVEPWGFDHAWRDPGVMVVACNHGPVHVKHEAHWGNDWMNVGGGDASQCFVNPADKHVVYGPWRVVKFFPKAGTPNPDREIRSYGFAGELFQSTSSPFDPTRAYALYGYRRREHGKFDLVVFNDKADERALRRFDSKIEDCTTAHTVHGFILLTEGGRVHLTRNLGKTWIDATPASVKSGDTETPWSSARMRIRLVAVDQLDAKTLYVAGSSDREGVPGFVLSSTDDGKTWTDITGSLYGADIRGDGPVRDIECQPGTKAGLYAITASRVAYRNADMPDWKNLSDGLPRTNMANYVRVAPTQNLVRIGTNKGFFERELAEPSQHFTAVRVDAPVQYARRGPYTVKYFDVSSAPTGSRFRWSFPGGTPATAEGESVEVAYAKPGTYGTSLEITTPEGKSLHWKAPATARLGTVANKFFKGPGDALLFKEPAAVRTALLAPISGPTLTVTGWLKPAEEVKGDSLRAAFSLDGKAGHARVFVQADGSVRTSLSGDGWNVNTGARLEPGKWSHLACVFDSGKATIYVNGVEAASRKHGTTTFDFATGDGFSLGGLSDGSCGWTGALDEVTLWSSALSPEGVKALHASALSEAEPGLLAYFQFDGSPDPILHIDPVLGHTVSSAAAASEKVTERIGAAVENLAFRNGEALADLKSSIGKKKLHALLDLERPSELADRVSAQDVQVLGRPIDDPVEVVPADRPAEPAPLP